MTDYRAPVQDYLFLLQSVLGIEKLENYKAAEMDFETTEAILQEAARFSGEVLAPLNHSGDQDGAKLDNGKVTTARGFQNAYAQYRDNGWNSVPFTPEYGGQGLPWSIAFAVQEMWQSANMSFGLCPLLNQGAVDALLHHGSDELKTAYLEKLISGEWTGTMNLTEPQAGSDLSLLKTKAERHDDGTYKIYGQKIYITYGEHDLAENIIHLVLARLPDAPEGTKGISLFLVPKFLLDENGDPGTRNDVWCTGIEHKLGIHASPTCTMQFGDNGGAVGYLIGQENEGLKCMFTMMNNARLSVGLQGVAVGERSYQHALHYAWERKQGKDVKTGELIPIAAHDDVKRMLRTMKSLNEAGRAMTLQAAYYLDQSAEGIQDARAAADLLTPIVKSWCTDRSLDVTSLGVQVHGGMGFVEETGAAQYYRDARILPIYEGTNGIQALDLHGRKVLRDQGVVAKAFLADLKKQSESHELPDDIKQGLYDLEEATDFVLSKPLTKITGVNSSYLDLWGYVLGGFYLAQSASIAKKSGTLPAEFINDKEAVSKFYNAHILPKSKSCLTTLLKGGKTIPDIELSL